MEMSFNKERSNKKEVTLGNKKKTVVLRYKKLVKLQILITLTVICSQFTESRKMYVEGKQNLTEVILGMYIVLTKTMIFKICF